MYTRTSKIVQLVLMSLLLGIGPLLVDAKPTSAKPMVMRIAHYQPEQRMLMVGAKWWADQVEKRTGGKISIQHYFSGSLAKAKEILPLVRQGGIEMGTPTIGYHRSDFPLNGMVGDYPFISFDQAWWVIPKVEEANPEIGAEWTKNNLVQLAEGNLGAYGFICRKPYKTLAEFQNAKVRTWGKTQPRKIVKLKMVPISMASSEIYEALSKGTVDGTQSNLDQHKSLSLYEIAKYHLKCDIYPIVTTAASPIMNLNVFNSLPPDLRQILVDLKADHLKKNKQLIEETEASDEKFLRDKGVTFFTASEADNKQIQQVNLEVFEEMLVERRKKHGAVIDRINDSLRKFTAEYNKTH